MGNPSRRDGSILLKSLDFSDNGTFTCDAKNPPDIVGRPSSVRLLVFEKGEVGGLYRGSKQREGKLKFLKCKHGIVLHLRVLISLPLSPYSTLW